MDGNYTRFTNCISLGWYCGTASAMSKFGFRSCSGPFDWLYSDLESVIAHLNNEFADFFVQNNLKTMLDNPRRFCDIKYGYSFFHDVNSDLSSEYDTILKKYTRRISRLIENAKEPTIFVRAIRSKDEVQYINKEYKFIDSVIKKYNEKNKIVYLTTDTIGPLSDCVLSFKLNIPDYGYDAVSLRNMFDNSPDFIEFCRKHIDDGMINDNLLYDNHSNASIATEILSMIRKKNSILSECIREFLEKNDCPDLYIWGVGYHGKNLIDYLKKNNIKIRGLIDSNHYGENYAGFTMLPPECATEKMCILVAVADQYVVNSIKKQIGMNCNLIITYKDLYNMILEKCTDYYIFGAHSRGWTLYHYMANLEPENRCLGFLYDNDDVNPEEIEGHSVVDLLDSGIDLDFNANVFIATRGEYHKKIKEVLETKGFRRIIPVTPILDSELRNKYIRLYFSKIGRDFRKIDNIVNDTIDAIDLEEPSDTYIYIAKSKNDTDFLEKVTLRQYERIIKVGKLASEDDVTDDAVSDNKGQNISKKNMQFCELTALYWIWKNAKQKIVGLEHWRRRFILPENWNVIMRQQLVDVILPVPLCVMPSLEENYKSRHIGEIWDAMLNVMEEVHPDYSLGARDYFQKNSFYSPCNMIIAKKEVLDEYCEWLFPILFKLNDQIGMVDDPYQNRYPGFISERLLSYYFDINRDRYTIVYADKSFLQ